MRAPKAGCLPTVLSWSERHRFFSSLHASCLVSYSYTGVKKISRDPKKEQTLPVVSNLGIPKTLNISRVSHYSKINTLWRVNCKCLKEQDIFSLGPECCVYLGVPHLQSFALTVKPWTTVVVGHWSCTSGVLSLLKCYMAVGLRFTDIWS